MCLEVACMGGKSTDTPPIPVKIAENAIIVYKRLQGNGYGKITRSEHTYFDYKPGVVEEEREFTTAEMPRLVHQGFHSWVTKDKANSIFVIPKGAKYFVGTENGGREGYCSSHIVYIGKRSLLTRLTKKTDYVLDNQSV